MRELEPTELVAAIEKRHGVRRNGFYRQCAMATASDDIGCGDGVATLTATLPVKGDGTANFMGCLHDLPALTVIPPKIWGAFQNLP
jgi:hypothetical protein